MSRKITTFAIGQNGILTWNTLKVTMYLCRWTNVFVHFLIFTDLLPNTISRTVTIEHLFDYLNKLPISRWLEIFFHKYYIPPGKDWVCWQRQRKVIGIIYLRKKRLFSGLSYTLWAKALGVGKCVDLWIQGKHVHGNSLPVSARS